MIKLEINLTGAKPDELRSLESLLKQLVSQVAPACSGIEATVNVAQAVDRYASTKKKIIGHIQWRKIQKDRCMTRDFWMNDIREWLNPKDRDNLQDALDSMCEDGILECVGEWEYFMTFKGYNEIY